MANVQPSFRSFHTAESIDIIEDTRGPTPPPQVDQSSLTADTGDTSIFPGYTSFVDKFKSPFYELYGFLCVYLRCMMNLLSPTEILIATDQSFYWRRSLMWSKEHGGDLKSYMTSKYANSSLLAGLLLSAEIAVLFSPSPPAQVRIGRIFKLHQPQINFFILTRTPHTLSLTPILPNTMRHRL